MRQAVWFKTLPEVGEGNQAFDIVCAELCGWGHYKMKGRLIVESRDDFDTWYKKMTGEQNTTTVAMKEGSR